MVSSSDNEPLSSLLCMEEMKNIIFYMDPDSDTGSNGFFFFFFESFTKTARIFTSDLFVTMHYFFKTG